MSLIFPDSPLIGDRHTQNGLTFEWSGFGWQRVTSINSLIGPQGEIGPVGPAGPQGASGDTANDILTKLLSVDGIGSGLDADTLQGFTPAELNAANTEIQIHVSDINNPHVVTPTQLGLGNVNNTSDVNKPVSTAQQTALNLKANLISPILVTPNLGTPTVLIGTNITGTASAFNAGTAATLTTPRTINGIVFDGSSNITINAVDSTPRVAASLLGVADGVATLDSSGLVPLSQLPSSTDDVLAFSSIPVFPAIGELGKLYIAIDTNKMYRWDGAGYTYITSGAVFTVAGRTGDVVVTKSDVGLSNVDNTSDANKPISIATATALSNKVDSIEGTATHLNITDHIHLAPFTPPAFLEGALWYDSEKQAMSYYTDIPGSSLQIGFENWVRVRNSTGVDLVDGTVVKIIGSIGQTPTIAKAIATTDSHNTVIGVLTSDLAKNNVGLVTTFGLIHDQNTSAYVEGTILYLSPAIAGAFTDVHPSAPNYATAIGLVVYQHVTKGKIFIRPVPAGIIGTEITLETTRFNKLLGVNDSSLQTALETLDQHTHFRSSIIDAVGGQVNLAKTSKPYQFINPNGADVTVLLPLVTAGDVSIGFTIHNTGIDGFNVIVKNYSNVQIGEVIPSGLTLNVIWDGAIWRASTNVSAPITHVGSSGNQHAVATQSISGFMSGTDKTKLDEIASGAQVNTVTSVAGKTGDVTLDKVDVGLSNVDNTADSLKPVSSAQQTSLDLKAPLISPTFTGTPVLPTGTTAITQSPGNNTTALATTSFVTTANALKANIASPSFTGTVSIAGDFSKLISSTSIVNGVFPIATGASTRYVDFPAVKYASHDMLAFNRGWGTPVYETFNGVWNASTPNSGLFAQKENQAITLIDGINDSAVRWTWQHGNVSWSSAQWMLLAVTYTPIASAKDLLIETSLDGISWNTRHISTGNTYNNQPALIGIGDWAGDSYFRLTVTVTNGQPLILSSMRCLSSRWGNQGTGSENSYPYLWDKDQNLAIGQSAVLSDAVLVIGTNTTGNTGGVKFGTDTRIYRSGTTALTITASSLTASGTISATSFNSITGLSSTPPLALGTASVGTSTTVARSDHVHTLPNLGTLGAQPIDADLTAIAALTGTGIARRTGADTWSLSGQVLLTTEVTGTLPVLNGGTGTTTATGTGSVVRHTSPTLTGTLNITGSSATPLELIRDSGANSNIRFGNTLYNTYFGLGTANGELRVGTAPDLTSAGTVYHSLNLLNLSQLSNDQGFSRKSIDETIGGSWTFTKVTSGITPVLSDHFATKQYVDDTSTGFKFLDHVEVATTGNITLSGLQVIDGISLIAGDRVLVKDQIISTENGIYDAAIGAWSRSSDFDNSPSVEVENGSYAFVQNGVFNISTGWVLSTANPIILGTTGITFTQFTGVGQITAGAGMTKTGTVLDVVSASSARIVVNVDNIDLATTSVTPGTYKSITIDAYGRATNGTNPTTLSAFGITDATPSSHIGSGGTSHADVIAAGNSGFMSGIDKTKLDSITSGASVSSVSGSGTVSGLTLTGTVTGSGELVLGGTISQLNQDTTGTAAGLSQTLAVASGGTGVTTATGTGSVVLSDSPTFTGSVVGITSTMVGLGNVTNTSDANKPVSTAQQTALNLKANIASPVFTGNVTGLGVASGTSFNSITGLASTLPQALGTASIGISTTAARSDHVHLLPSLATLGAQPAGTYATGTGSATGTNTGDNAVNSLYSGLISNATHTGDVTGDTALTIAPGVVTLAKMANMPSGSIIYRKTAATGVPETQTLATLKTDLGLTGTNSGDNPGVTSVTGTGTVSGLTLSGSITSTGTLTLSGPIDQLNQNTTGSAASLTTSRTIGGVLFNGTADIAPLFSNSYGLQTVPVARVAISPGLSSYRYYNSGGPTAYGEVVSFGSNANSGGHSELAISWSGTPSAHIRSLRDTTDNWTSWVPLLSSLNYNTYAPTLTGTGASGTWAISVTGNAATSNSIIIGGSSDANADRGVRMSSFSNSTSSINFPTSFGVTIETRRASGSSSANGTFQIFSDNSASENYSIRKITAYTTTDVWSSWKTLVHSGNIGTQSVSSATTATNALSLGGALASTFVSKNTSFVSGHHAEGRYLASAALMNDFGNARLRGSIFTFTNISPSDASIDSLFSGKADFINLVVQETWPVVIEFTLPRTLTWGASIGIGFGASSWVAQNVHIEAFSEGAWVTCINTTSNTSEDILVSIPGNLGIGTNKVRYTISTPLNSSIRLCHLWGFNYASDMWSQLQMPRAGGTMYGALNVADVVTGTSFNSITALSSTTPTMNGIAAIGTSTTVARSDHIHASDTTKANLESPIFTGTVSGITVAMVTNALSNTEDIDGGTY